MTNCPNCGAPVEKQSDKCSYCETPYKKPKERKPGEGCKGCFYRKRIDGVGPMVCQYSLMTGKLRGCPPGEGCIRYIKGSKGKRLRTFLAEF